MKVLSLDLSTSCTGFAIFNTEEKHMLLTSGIIEPDNKGLAKLEYPEKQLIRMQRLSENILILIESQKPDLIVIEEITGSGVSSRLSQKTLDGFHYVLLGKIQAHIKKVKYIDVSGPYGWRFFLNIRLADQDKILNKERKVLNKKLHKGMKKLPIISWKHLSVRYVNSKLDLKHKYDVDVDVTAGDECDAICIGQAYIKHVLK